MIYLASPYSHEDSSVEQARYECVRDTVVHFTTLYQNNIYSPIVYFHPIAKLGNLPGNAEYWEDYNKEMIGFSDRMLFLFTEGWRQSKGMQREFLIGGKLNKRMQLVTVAGQVLPYDNLTQAYYR